MLSFYIGPIKRFHCTYDLGTLSLSGILCKPNTGQVIMQYKKYMGETKSSREVGVLKTDIVEFNLK
jgi:hypothetical protein